MKTTRFLRIAIPVAGALLLAAGAVAVTASATGLNAGSLLAATSPSPGTAAGSGAGAAACQAYLGHLATELGISADKLNAAAIAAGKDTIQDRVAAGDLTQAQADKIEARLSSSDVCSFAAGRRKLAAAVMGYLYAAADALGVSRSQLVSDLKSGQTLSQVASAEGVSEDQFKSSVVGTLKPKLDAAVSAGKITQAQEDKALAKIQNGDPPLWNRTPKSGG